MMSHKCLIIKRLTRYPQTGSHDELIFKRGVNVLVGQPNTGKTQWLRMLDYLWGDPDPAKDAFDEDLVEKYDRIEAVIEIDHIEHVIERRWKEKGSLGKVFIDGEAVLVEEFSKYFLNMLNLPVVHYPKGNPYSSSKWPILSWRELYRHIYRRQDSWSDLAARQPESTQLACILYFLGIAENIYSDTYGEVVRLNKEIGSLEAARAQFAKLLDRFSRDLMDLDSEGQVLTREKIDQMLENIQIQIADFNFKRERFFLDIQAQQVVEGNQNSTQDLGQKWEIVQDSLNQIHQAIVNTRNRLSELEEYRDSVNDEYDKLKRARIAGKIMADLRVTHCPACDREVNIHNHPDHCYLCKEPNSPDEDAVTSEQRLDFEFARLGAEKSESNDLVSFAARELSDHLKQQKLLQEDAERIRVLMRPIQRASAAILPPELAIIDNNLGALSERKRQLLRLKDSLSIRQEILDESAKLVAQRDELEKELDIKTSIVDFEESANDLANGINFYLIGEIVKQNPQAWTQGKVSVNLHEKSFSIKVGEKSWRKLGGTMSLYFLMAYNYALLRLSNSPAYRYPGLLILDMPAKFEDTQVTRDETESFVIEPFVKIKNQTNNMDYQVIVTGSKFEGLNGVNRIELDTVWT